MADTVKKRRQYFGKWSLYRHFKAVPEIGKYLPVTAVLTQQSLQKFLKQYSSVYVKPTDGARGRGITKVWKRAEGGYAFVVVSGTPVHCQTIAELYQKLRAGQSSSLHIVQKAIPLAKINGRSFDIRLMMVRNDGNWEAVGMLAKVAGPNSVITNVARSKGYALDVDTALKESLGLSEEKCAALKKEMIALGHRTVERFDALQRHPEIGLDLAVDVNGRLWMIEENTRPSQLLFAKLPDKSMYRRIMELARKRRANKSKQV